MTRAARSAHVLCADRPLQTFNPYLVAVRDSRSRSWRDGGVGDFLPRRRSERPQLRIAQVRAAVIGIPCAARDLIEVAADAPAESHLGDEIAFSGVAAQDLRYEWRARACNQQIDAR